MHFICNNVRSSSDYCLSLAYILNNYFPFYYIASFFFSFYYVVAAIANLRKCSPLLSFAKQYFEVDLLNIVRLDAANLLRGFHHSFVGCLGGAGGVSSYSTFRAWDHMYMPL